MKIFIKIERDREGDLEAARDYEERLRKAENLLESRQDNKKRTLETLVVDTDIIRERENDLAKIHDQRNI